MAERVAHPRKSSDAGIAHVQAIRTRSDSIRTLAQAIDS